MTTLLPGISFPSLSAASTMAFAILSLTEPPAEVNSSLPTEDSHVSDIVCNQHQRVVRTKVAFEALLIGNPVESDEGCVSDSSKSVVKDLTVG
jgi:hypothetical protein